jgi:hypothetical protein
MWSIGPRNLVSCQADRQPVEGTLEHQGRLHGWREVASLATSPGMRRILGWEFLPLSPQAGRLSYNVLHSTGDAAVAQSAMWRFLARFPVARTDGAAGRGLAWVASARADTLGGRGDTLSRAGAGDPHTTSRGLELGTVPVARASIPRGASRRA